MKGPPYDREKLQNSFSNSILVKINLSYLRRHPKALDKRRISQNCNYTISRQKVIYSLMFTAHLGQLFSCQIDVTTLVKDRVNFYFTENTDDFANKFFFNESWNLVKFDGWYDIFRQEKNCMLRNLLLHHKKTVAVSKLNPILRL